MSAWWDFLSWPLPKSEIYRTVGEALRPQLYIRDWHKDLLGIGNNSYFKAAQPTTTQAQVRCTAAYRGARGIAQWQERDARRASKAVYMTRERGVGNGKELKVAL